MGGRQFEGGKRVPDRRGDGRSSLLSVSSPRQLPRSSPPGAGSGSWGRTARGDDPPASGTGTAGVGTELRAARGQVANWIRERGGENLGRVGSRAEGPGPPEPPSGEAVPTSGRPVFLHRADGRGFQGKRTGSPGEDICSLKPLLCPCPDPKKTQALGAAPRSDAGRSRGPAPGRGPGPRSRAGGRASGRARAGSGLGGAGGGGRHPGSPRQEPAGDLRAEVGWGQLA